MKQSIHAKRMERQHRRSSGIPKLNLVSLMDIFTILVFFLLVNSSDVEVLQSNKDITLPESVATTIPAANVVIMVSATEVLVGGRKVANVADFINSDDDIQGLKKELDYLASRKPFTSDAEAEIGREITVMADESIPYAVLKRVMSTCAQTDYRNISLAVNQVADSSVPVEAQAEAPSAAIGG